MKNDDLLKAINSSGFPLQISLKGVIESVRGWRVVLSEHPWVDPLSNDEKFIDLVIKGNDDPRLNLVIECKRSLQTEYLFLRESAVEAELGVWSRLIAKRPTRGVSIDGWAEASFTPGSPLVNYCVVRKGGQPTKDLLERNAAEVVRATECLAEQELSLFEKHHKPVLLGDFIRAYVPIIVTTAQLYVCDAEYSELNLTSGEVSTVSALPAPFVRFTKSLSRPTPVPEVADIEAFAKLSQRTVIIVQANFLPELLRKWDMSRRMGAELTSALF